MYDEFVIFIIYLLFFLILNENDAPSRHPLYPLVSTLFEICDQLTNSSNFNPSKNVNGEIQNFMVRCHHEGISICTGDSEVDELVFLCFTNFYFDFNTLHTQVTDQFSSLRQANI